MSCIYPTPGVAAVSDVMSCIYPAPGVAAVSDVMSCIYPAPGVAAVSDVMPALLEKHQAECLATAQAKERWVANH